MLISNAAQIICRGEQLLCRFKIEGRRQPNKVNKKPL
jgi:hypothetical protein